MQPEEKKVEYIELIYDLVFVYFLGRDNELLQHIDGGFFTFVTYANYLLGILVILQIWYFSTLFINRYGDNSAGNTIGLFINMYLIYYLANGTRIDWSNYYARYNIAWGLIFINLAAQYFLHLFKEKKKHPWELPYIKRHILLHLIQAAIIFASIPFYNLLHFPLSWISILVGFIVILLSKNVDSFLPVNFEHLTERVMLFVVFTFGEMIISVAVYFEGRFVFNMFYFSFMTFLIVAGLFVSYGFLYNHIIDRQRITTGAPYLLLHFVLLVSLCNISASLVFMRKTEVNAVSKNIFMVVSFLLYFIFLLLLGTFSKEDERLHKKTLLLLSAAGLLYVAAMALTYTNSYVSVAASVLFIFSVHLLLVFNHRKGCTVTA